MPDHRPTPDTTPSPSGPGTTDGSWRDVSDGEENRVQTVAPPEDVAGAGRPHKGPGPSARSCVRATLPTTSPHVRYLPTRPLPPRVRCTHPSRTLFPTGPWCPRLGTPKSPLTVLPLIRPLLLVLTDSPGVLGLSFSIVSSPGYRPLSPVLPEIPFLPLRPSGALRRPDSGSTSSELPGVLSRDVRPRVGTFPGHRPPDSTVGVSGSRSRRPLPSLLHL